MGVVIGWCILVCVWRGIGWWVYFGIVYLGGEKGLWKVCCLIGVYGWVEEEGVWREWG